MTLSEIDGVMKELFYQIRIMEVQIRTAMVTKSFFKKAMTDTRDADSAINDLSDDKAKEMGIDLRSGKIPSVNDIISAWLEHIPERPLTIRIISETWEYINNERDTKLEEIGDKLIDRMESLKKDINNMATSLKIEGDVDMSVVSRNQRVANLMLQLAQNGIAAVLELSSRLIKTCLAY